MTAHIVFDPPLDTDETEWLDMSLGRVRGGVRDLVAAAVLRGPWILHDVTDWRVNIRQHVDADLTLELVIFRVYVGPNAGRFTSAELREIHTVNQARRVDHALELITP